MICKKKRNLKIKNQSEKYRKLDGHLQIDAKSLLWSIYYLVNFFLAP